MKVWFSLDGLYRLNECVDTPHTYTVVKRKLYIVLYTVLYIVLYTVLYTLLYTVLYYELYSDVQVA